GDADGGKQVFNLDKEGRVAEEIDPNGNVSRMVYDTAGGLTGTISPLGHFYPIPEHPNAPDPLAHRVPDCPLEWEYGDLMPRDGIRPPTSADPLRQVPQFAWKFLKTVDPKEVATRTGAHAAPDGFHYLPDGQVCDAFGLRIKQVEPDGGIRHWTYDAVGNVRRYQDYGGSTFHYEYTSWNLRSRATG